MGRIVVSQEGPVGAPADLTFTVTPAGGTCLVRIETQWDGAGGIGGFFERTFAPRVMRRLSPTSWRGSTPTPAARPPVRAPARSSS
jgi:hypothetical protein